jgi:hypothetical protein
MALLSVGPEDMAADEHKIGKGYQLWAAWLYPAIPIAVAAYGDTKWVVATGFAVLIAQGSEAGGRLHDLCIRLRRTNILLNEK